MPSTSPSPLGNFGPQRSDFDAFVAAVTGSRGPLGDDWRRQTARRRLAVDRDRLGELRERAIDAAEAEGRDTFDPGSWASGVAFTAADGINLFGIERNAFDAAMVDAAWAIVVEDLMPAEAADLYAAVEPLLPRDRFRPAPAASEAGVERRSWAPRNARGGQRRLEARSSSETQHHEDGHAVAGLPARSRGRMRWMI